MAPRAARERRSPFAQRSDRPFPAWMTPMNSSSPTDSLISIGLTAEMLQRLIARPAYSGESPMRVIEMRRDAACLHDGQHEVVAVLPPALAQTLADDALAVG